MPHLFLSFVLVHERCALEHLRSCMNQRWGQKMIHQQESRFDGDPVSLPNIPGRIWIAFKITSGACPF
ncbi:MAG: hypothetical protein EBU26_03860 [Verrucomicrobia bacterium]|nr:hypothetical protein [Verrucomicrobiota bacterium]